MDAVTQPEAVVDGAQVLENQGFQGMPLDLLGPVQGSLRPERRLVPPLPTAESNQSFFSC